MTKKWNYGYVCNVRVLPSVECDVDHSRADGKLKLRIWQKRVGWIGWKFLKAWCIEIDTVESSDSFSLQDEQYYLWLYIGSLENPSLSGWSRTVRFCQITSVVVWWQRW